MGDNPLGSRLTARVRPYTPPLDLDPARATEMGSRAARVGGAAARDLVDVPAWARPALAMIVISLGAGLLIYRLRRRVERFAPYRLLRRRSTTLRATGNRPTRPQGG